MANPTNAPNLNIPIVDENLACDRYTLSLDDRCIVESEPIRIAEFCGLLESNSPPKPLLTILFFPKIAKDQGGTEPVLHPARGLCERLSAAMKIDPYFFTEAAWDSNGFFMPPKSWTVKGITYHSSSSRFLIKVLNVQSEQVNRVDYNWLFISFCVIFVERKDTDSRPSQIVVCFDDCKKRDGHELMYESIIKACQDYISLSCASHPLGMQSVLARALAFEYDKALWRFRKPVREIEKSRKAFLDDLDAVEPQDEHGQRKQGNRLFERYEHMAEISRHIIHMRETLQAAARVVESILESSRGTCKNHQEEANTEVYESLRFSRDFLANLQLRTEAFVDRLQNEISLAFNIVNAKDLKATQQLVQDSKDEGRDMTAILTLVTLTFFPSTVISGIFGMNFFAPSTDNQRIVSTPDIWMFVLIDIVLTAIPLVLYYGVHYRKWKPFDVFPIWPREGASMA